MHAYQRSDPAVSRILIVEDHPVVRSGLRSLIETEADLTVCAEAEDLAGALDALEYSRPDLALIDISLKRSNGLTLVKRIDAAYPRTRSLVCSMHDEAVYAERALKAGARGYVMKSEPTDRIVAAIRAVIAGNIYLSEAMTRAAVHRLRRGAAAQTSPVDLLSDGELELFQLTGQGKEIAEIARIMSISPRTVEVHRSHIKKKLSLKTGTEIFQSAYEWLRESGLRP